VEFYAVIHITKFCTPMVIYPWPNKQNSRMCIRIRMTFSSRISGASPSFRYSMITTVLTKNKERSQISFIDGAAFSKLKFDLLVRGRLGSISCIDVDMPR
jgi:hypothetical protein